VKRRLATPLRATVGILFWIALGTLGYRGLRETDLGREVSARLGTHFRAQPEVIEVRFPRAATLRTGAAVRLESEEGFVQVGAVEALRDAENGQVAKIRLFPDFAEEFESGGRFLAHETRGDIAWILKTLFPAEMQERLKETFRRRWERHQDELLRELQPGLTRLTEDLTAALRDDLDRVIRERDADFRVLGEVLVEKGWEGPIEEAVRDEIWPQLRERAEPLIADIGDEMIAAFPVGSAAWDLFVDKLPFSEERRIRERLRRFADEKALPILERREPEFRQVALEVMRKSAANPRVRDALGQAAEKVARDPRFRDALLSVLRAWVAENEGVAKLLREIPNREDLRAPMLRFLRRFEPDIHRLANEVVLNEAGDGIDPELARVLRRKILRDDERWLSFEPRAPQDAEEVPAARVFLGEAGGTR
jgi:hypothetical protein